MQILHINVSWIKSKIDTVPLLSSAHKDELTSWTPSLIILVAIGAWLWPSNRAWNLQLLNHQDNEEKVSCMAQVLQTVMTYNLNLNLQWCRFICQWINWDLPYHFNKNFYFFVCRLTWCISSTGGSVNFDPTGCLRTWCTRRSSLEDTAQRNWWFRGSLWVYLTLWYYPRLHLRASLYTGYPSDSLCQLPEKWEDGYIIVGVHSSELKSHISHYMWSQLLIGTFIIYVGDGGAYVVCWRLVWPIRSVGIITATFFQKLSSVIYSQFHHVRRSYTRPCWVFRLTPGFGFGMRRDACVSQTVLGRCTWGRANRVCNQFRSMKEKTILYVYIQYQQNIT